MPFGGSPAVRLSDPAEGHREKSSYSEGLPGGCNTVDALQPHELIGRWLGHTYQECWKRLSRRRIRRLQSRTRSDREEDACRQRPGHPTCRCGRSGRHSIQQPGVPGLDRVLNRSSPFPRCFQQPRLKRSNWLLHSNPSAFARTRDFEGTGSKLRIFPSGSTRSLANREYNPTFAPMSYTE